MENSEKNDKRRCPECGLFISECRWARHNGMNKMNPVTGKIEEREGSTRCQQIQHYRYMRKARRGLRRKMRGKEDAREVSEREWLARALQALYRQVTQRPFVPRSAPVL